MVEAKHRHRCSAGAGPQSPDRVAASPSSAASSTAPNITATMSWSIAGSTSYSAAFDRTRSVSSAVESS